MNRFAGRDWVPFAVLDPVFPAKATILIREVNCR